MHEFGYHRPTTRSALIEYLSHQVSQSLMDGIAIIPKMVDAFHQVINEDSNG